MNALTVFIVDDDPGMRYSLSVLLETADLTTRCFATAEAFLEVCSASMAGCLLLDVRLPGMLGPELQAELVQRQVRLPIIFLTAYADLPVGVEAMKRGAVDFLTKPVNGAVLLQRVQAALALDAERRRADELRHLFLARINKLTGREREVLGLAVSGMASKDICTYLNISLRTIEGHRSRIYLKTGVNSLLELAQQAANAGVSVARMQIPV